MSDAKVPVTTSLRGKGKLTAAGTKKWFQYYRNANITRNAIDILLPIFEGLTKPDLLERCMSQEHVKCERVATFCDLEESSKARERLGIVQFNKGAKMLIDVTAAIVPQAGPSRQLSALVDRCDDGRCPSGWTNSPALYSCGQNGSGEPC